MRENRENSFLLLKQLLGLFYTLVKRVSIILCGHLRSLLLKLISCRLNLDKTLPLKSFVMLLIPLMRQTALFRKSSMHILTNSCYENIEGLYIVVELRKIRLLPYVLFLYCMH